MFAYSSFNQPLYSWVENERVVNRDMFLRSRYSYPITHFLYKGYGVQYLIGDTPYAFPLDFSSYPKTYAPKSKEVLKLIVNDRAIPLYSIDVRGVKDMSYLFKGCLREDWEYAGIECWDMSGVESVEGMFEGCKYQHSKRFFELQTNKK